MSNINCEENCERVPSGLADVLACLCHTLSFQSEIEIKENIIRSTGVKFRTNGLKKINESVFSTEGKSAIYFKQQ